MRRRAAGIRINGQGEEVTALVVGASGATGRLLLGQLLDRGQHVKAIVRSAGALPAALARHDRLTVVEAAVLDLSDAELAAHAQGCAAMASCLGHKLSWKGIYGPPRKLVTEATIRLCRAIKVHEPEAPVRFVLMNTAGNSNRDLHEPLSLAQRGVIGLLRVLLPPHVDNEKAADYLRAAIGQDDGSVQWSAVRPDTLVDEDSVTEYEVHPSPTRSAIFNAGSTSRINVAHFMAELMTGDDAWGRWRGRMPVIYNKEARGAGRREARGLATPERR